jgi:hypothetical protein
LAACAGGDAKVPELNVIVLLHSARCVTGWDDSRDDENAKRIMGEGFDDGIARL